MQGQCTVGDCVTTVRRVVVGRGGGRVVEGEVEGGWWVNSIPLLIYERSFVYK